MHRHEQSASQPSDEISSAPPGSGPVRPAWRFVRWCLDKLLNAAIVLAVGVLLIVALGIAQRTGWISAGGGEQTVNSPSADQVFTCSMHPQIRQPHPGRCPICGMELVAATTSGGTDLDDISIKINSAQRRLSNIETAEVKQEPVVATIHTVGSIAIDESRMATIASYIDGRLERLFADYTGVDVAEGDHLAVIYSPELYSAQVEYMETRKAIREMSSAALAAVREAQTRLATNSRHRLVELGMTAEQIIELEQTDEAKSRLTIYTPIGGTVIEKLAVEGKYVTAGEPIYRIADLSTVWLVLELFPEDAARIRYGQRVEAEMQSLPDQVFEGRVAFIDPQVNPRHRTVGVRVEFLNDEAKLRPGDYANANIFLPVGQTGEVYDAYLAGRWISPMHPQIISELPGKCTICGMDLVPTSEYGYSNTPVAQPVSRYVPRSAVLMAGSNSVVYVESEPGRFEIRPVIIGPILRDKVIIVAGLEPGERIATAGNFLIDSQMQLAGKPSLIDPSRAMAGKVPRKKPLKFTKVRVAHVPGATGSQLESLYDVYFSIQQSLAADLAPTAADATKLHRLATALAANLAIPSDARAQLSSISRHSQHLHHLDLDKARLDAFRPISHSIVALAVSVRGDAAGRTFHHMFCPMVKGGAGDWLQATGLLRNPYFGSQMIGCGEVIREFLPAEVTEDMGDAGGRSTVAAVAGTRDPELLRTELLRTMAGAATVLRGVP